MENTLRRPSCILGALCAIVTGCVEPLDTTRDLRAELSLGGEIYLELCNRIAAQEDPLDVSGLSARPVCLGGKRPGPQHGPRLHAMHAQRARIIGAIDDIVRDDRVPALKEFLIDIVPHYDDGYIPDHTRKTGALLDHVLASPDALDALERVGSRTGYRPLRLAAGVAQPVLAYPDLETFLTQLLDAAAPGGDLETEWRALMQAMHTEMSGAQPSADPGGFRRRVWLAQSPAFSDGRARYVAERDARGVVVPESQGGYFVSPFVDSDTDGLADVNRAGGFVNAAGQALSVPAPFEVPGESAVFRDADGRLLGGDGKLIYRYVDASQTVVAGALLEVEALLQAEAGALLDLTQPARHLLGPEAARQHGVAGAQSFTYRGFNVDRSPLVELAHAGGALLDAPATYWTLRLLEDATGQHERELAATVEMAHDIGDWLDAPHLRELSMEPDNTLADDLLELTMEIAREPGLLEDVLAALRAPQTRDLGAYFAGWFRHKDRIDYDPNDINAPAVGWPHTPVDWSASDTFDNQSIMQRFFHLIYDTYGARLCNKPEAVLDLGFISYPFFGGYDECELFEIDNMAVFYVQALLGEARLEFKDPLIDFTADFDFLLETLSGLDGFARSPTPQAVNRMIFAPRNNFLQNLIDPPRALDGGSIEARHPGTIFAWEAAGFFDALRPLAQAFADHGREDLFVELMAIHHQHWSTPEADTTQSADPLSPAYSRQSGARRFEEVFARAMDEGRALEVIGDLLTVIHQTTLEGNAGDDILVDLVRQLLLPEWNEGLTFRDGRTFAVKADGTRVNGLAPIWLLKGATAALADALDAHPVDRDRMANAKTAVVEQLLGVERLGVDVWFENRRLYSVLPIVLSFTADTLAEHHAAGDVSQWAAGTSDRLANSLDSPLVAAALNLVDGVVAHPALRAQLDALVRYLMSTASPNDAYDHTLTTVVDFLQLLDDDTNVVPIMRAMAPAMHPEDGVVQQSVGFLRALRSRDDSGLLTEMLRNTMASRSDSSGEVALESLLEGISQVNRQIPGAAVSMSAKDYCAVLGAVRDFLADEERGAERLYTLIENR